MEKSVKVTESELESKVLDVCYTRHICESLSIDYVNLAEDDIEKIRQYILETYQLEEK